MSDDGDRLELKLDEQYHKTKRALLVATSLCIIFGLSGGTDAKIPGFGDIGLPIHYATLLIWFACVYFADEFRREWRMAFIRNSQAVAAEADHRLGALFEGRASLERELAKTIEQTSASLATALPRALEDSSGAGMEEGPRVEIWDRVRADLNIAEQALDQVISSVAVSVQPDMTPSQIADRTGPLRPFMKQLEDIKSAIQGGVERLNMAVANADEVSRRLGNSHSELQKAFSDQHARLDGAATRDAELLASFGALHKSIHRTQRNAVAFRDRYIPIAMFAMATALTAWKVYAGVPAIKGWIGSVVSLLA
ncbi:hypothetical protein CA223_05385 [Sphingomonas koreensis]|uniref:Uncharacterized protein n=1 Tax=Sphingomonas koreensis TaxID=93064 RepID=A0A1L6JBP3_9SPHN|nr:hypothetical protein [Sphingomonas koreensis]APR53349.1 hypothetical protein BRX40_13740 [Sphingomonas koreensis]MDC7809959.1 hypothetical protein [Sphingomonas koreensis]RSU24531.1 hypothetical protein CA224_02095 [Sphingomonas koreensis]RSU25176.1 hypothetical protein CA222_13690 [Sphingomonas koreensis]RSU30149.1 hypothetical protein CA225_05660 [Sphingomonas koreensis]